ncbi:hypothetical protein AQI95_08245 [Streptomyces yokosukanensis]|uniref:Integral membrane protein n=1 Tax=Streptomyces yokosukanensis TaxID=67386 RepID=A0A101PBD9_9ACTN|nr:hypothetical protein [Streptomyces yokosukanensis]KUN08358.1 hypothetical protein AQI95_08245 [Streptomyces yokosukanensis]
MPDRSLRLLTFPPRPARGGERGAALLRDHPASPPEAPGGHTGQGGHGRGDAGPGEGAGQQDDGRGTGQQDDNPFAPPPEGAPDRPWQPRHPEGSHDQGGRGSGPGGGSPWGSQWSDRQPGRSPGGFGERPGGGPQGPGSGGPSGSGMRWDPTDPAQRRARYALLCGMWAVFFALFSWPYVSLLLGALALYWGISALRAKPRDTGPDAPPATGAGRPQTTAAVGGLLTASLALVLVASTFTVQLVYQDYYTCVGDALTHEAKQSCDQLLPQQLRGVLGVGNS